MESISGTDQATEGDGAAEPHRHVVIPVQIQPFWILVGAWSVLCGALATNPLRWYGETFLSLAFALLLVTVAWAGLWIMVTGTGWVSLLRGRALSPAALPILPYTRPDSPAGRLGQGLSHRIGWWREAFWPAAGPISVMCLLAVFLATVLSLLLPVPVWWLNLALVAIVAMGVAQRYRGRTPLAAQALLYAGLPWLAGFLALSRFRWHALLLALLFTLAVWGVLRVARGMAGGPWLLHGAQVGVAVLLVILGQPLPAGGIVILAFGQFLSSLTLRFGGEPAAVARRTWPWLLAAMLLAALAIP